MPVTPAGDPRTARNPSLAPLDVELLNVGWLTSPAGLWRQGEPFDRDIRFPIPAYLIATDEERILVDTGLHPAAVADAARHYGDPEALSRFRLELEQSIADQVDLTTITKVVLTHLHFDHAGGLSLLPRTVPIIVQRREWEAGYDRSAVERNFYFPHDYVSVEPQVLLIDGDHDLLGDGSIRLLLTPGHTPGHQSVAIGERLVLGVDVAHFASTLDDHRFPAFADDFAVQTASAQRLRALRDQGVRVLPGHDPDVLTPGTVLASYHRTAASRAHHGQSGPVRGPRAIRNSAADSEPGDWTAASRGDSPSARGFGDDSLGPAAGAGRSLPQEASAPALTRFGIRTCLSQRPPGLRYAP